MIALLRKDQPWIVFFVVAGTAALTIALASEQFGSVWLFPPRRLEGLFYAAWIAGVALGLFAASYDELLGTRDYLRHRPLAPWRLHAGRVLGCVVVLVAWMLLPALLQWLGEIGFGELAPLGFPSRILDVWAFQVVAWSGCAVGLFAATLPCGHELRVILGGAALLALFAAVEAFASAEGGLRHDAGRFVAGNLAGALLLGGASFVTARRDADPDRPWPAASRYLGASIVAVAFAGAGTLGIALLQHEQLSSYRRSAPMAAEVDGQWRLVLWRELRRKALLLPSTPDHEVDGEPIGRERLSQSWSMRDLNLGYRDPWTEPRFRWTAESGWGRAVIDSEGKAYVLRFDPLTRRRSFLVTGKESERLRFARGARGLRVRSGLGLPAEEWVAEPGAAALWRLGDGDEYFHAVPLPGGDRVVSVTRLRPDPTTVEERLDVGDLRYRLEVPDGDAIIGARGIYVIQGNELVPAPAGMIVEPTSGPHPRVEVVADDLLAPRVQVLDPAGTVQFEHAFAPRNGAERFHAALLLFLSALRPMPLQLAAHGVEFPPRVAVAGVELPQRALWFDPLLANGGRPWLLLLTFSVALAAAFAAYYRLRRLGAPVSVRRFWVVSCVALGPAGLLASILIERRRAHAPAPVQQEPVPAPRIVSLQPS